MNRSRFWLWVWIVVTVLSTWAHTGRISRLETEIASLKARVEADASKTRKDRAEQ